MRTTKLLSMFAVLLTLGMSLGISDAEAARRLGGGKSSGMQRQMIVPNKPANVAPAPAQSTAQAAAPSAAAGGAAAGAAPKRSWLGPLAGLAAGLGIAALASHFGFGGELASVLMMGLLLAAGVALFGFLMRRRVARHSAPAYAGTGAGDLAGGNSPARDAAPLIVSGAPGGTASASAPANLPADFDVTAFVRNAKVNFIRLQAAYDRGDLDDLREFTTPEMFAELKMEIAERGGVAQETDVVTVDAEVLDVVEESNRYIVSVRFSGLLREEKNAPAEGIDEIWHLTKPRHTQGGWLLAGIQQTQ